MDRGPPLGARGSGRKGLLYEALFALEPDEKTAADKALAGAKLWPEMDARLREIAVVDPACGSGSFLVGMLHLLDDLQARAAKQLDMTETPYDRKKRIIGQDLYGVDVMDWACHVAELRLWLALTIDAEFTPEELHARREPLLPHFTFKIRCGDSLVQEVGGINLGHLRGSPDLPRELKARITRLKNEKLITLDIKTQDAVIRNLEIIGEATKNLSLSYRSHGGRESVLL